MKYRVTGVDGKAYGPVTFGQLQQWLAQGRVNAQTFVYADGAKNWVPLASLPEFTAAFPAPPATIGAVSGPAARGTNKCAVAGLICSLLAWTCCCLPFNLLGAILCVIALVQLSLQSVPQEGRMLAVVGLVLSVASIGFDIVMMVISLATNQDSISWQTNFS